MDVDDFRRSAADWLRQNRGHAPRDYGAIVPAEVVGEAKAWQRRLFDAGFAGIDWPRELGGRGLTAAHQAVWLEEAALADVPPFLNMVGIVLAGGTIRASGTAAQQADHLPPTLTGERVWCQLFSEPGAGSDLASLATRAEADGDDFVVTGQKVWCSNGRVSDWGILLARTDADAPKHRGISFFLLDMRLAGVEVRPLVQMTGGSEFDEVFLDEVRVRGDCLVGPLHGGWGVAMATLTNERGHIGASAISLGRRVDELLAGAGEDGAAGGAARADGAGAARNHAGAGAPGAGAPGDGAPGTDPGTDPRAAVHRQQVTALAARGRALQHLGRRQGPVASTAASLMKLGITELLFDLAEARADAAGATAMLAGDESDALLAAPGARIAGGTSQVQRNIIGELLLGLPKEPRSP